MKLIHGIKKIMNSITIIRSETTFKSLIKIIIKTDYENESEQNE